MISGAVLLSMIKVCSVTSGSSLDAHVYFPRKSSSVIAINKWLFEVIPFSVSDSISTPRSLFPRFVLPLFHVMVAGARVVHVK